MMRMKNRLLRMTIIALFLYCLMPVLQVQADIVCYVDALIGNDDYDGSSPTVGTSSVGPKRTIQAGVNACPVGGTVSVATGTYTEAVYVNKRIALIGAGSNSTTITASGLGATNTVTFDGTATNGALTSGFRITGATGIGPNNGTNTGNGIYCNNGSPTITNNTLTGNAFAGIYCDKSSPTIINNIIGGNRYSGYGIYCSVYCSPIIINNMITANKSCGILCFCACIPIIIDNAITGNGWDGIWLNQSSGTITNNMIAENSSYGIKCQKSSPTIINNMIIRNDLHGIWCFNDSFPIIINNTISGNNWHGICCQASSFPTIINNVITENGTINTDYYGIYNDTENSGILTIDYNCVWKNGQGGNNNYGGVLSDQTVTNGNISTNPQFIGNGDYHLQSISPCINAGTGTVLSYITTDADNNPRKVGKYVDIGVYEYQGTPTLTITTTNLPDGYVGLSYYQPLSVSHGIPPYSWFIISGTLSSGLSLVTSTGIISVIAQ